MATKDARGTKRTCQSGECGARFYDLNKDPITCPICGTIYALARLPAGVTLEHKPEKPARKAKKTVDIDPANPIAAEADDEDELDGIETDDVEDDADDSDTFLEDEEDDDGNVTAIIPGSRESGEEDT